MSNRSLFFLTVTCFVVQVLVITTACSTSKTPLTTMDKPQNTPQPPVSIKYIEVILNPSNRQTALLPFNPSDSILTRAAKETNLQTLIGVLQFNPAMHPVSSVLTMNGWDVPLTGIRMIEARSPMPITIEPLQIGKLALVQGFFDGATLYQAHIIAVFSDTPMDLLYRLLGNNCPDIEPFLQRAKD